ncbi:MAG: serine hydrolase domain-containing protein [Gammaproteobacteria bacterium]|nr:serine hydrolase domain-containing protein [Gammaproteobacteria bacterium]
MRIFVIIGFLLLACPLFAQADDEVRVGDPRPRGNDESLAAAIDALRLRHDLVGVSAAVFDRESVRTFASGNGISNDSRFRLGSAGEVLVALVVGLLAEDGSLSLDDAVLDRAPEVDLRNDWYADRPVRIEDLLMHRAGLAQPHYRDIVMPADGQPLLAAINRSFRAGETAFRPGSRYRHSVLNTAIAAYIAEEAAAAPLQDIIDPLVNVPLGTSILLGQPSSNVAPAHDAHGRPIQPLELNLAAAGDWWVTARDLAIFLQLLLNDGERNGERVLGPDLVALLEGPAELPGPRTRGFRREYPGGILQFGLRGRTPGYRAAFAYLPERNGGYVLLVNQGGSAAAIADFEELLRGQLETTLPAQGLDPGDHPPAILSGYYRRSGDISPPQQMLLDMAGPLRARPCRQALCLRGPGIRERQLVAAATADGWLRDRRLWWSDWQWQESDEGLLLWNSAAEWRQVPAWKAWWPLAALLVLLPGSGLAILQLTRVPLKGWRNRKRIDGWLELFPTALSGVAVLAALAVPILFHLMSLPELARPGAMAIGLLAASIVAPVFAVLALPAYLVALWRRHLYAPLRSGVGLVTALAWAGIFLAYDVIAFQAWNW